MSKYTELATFIIDNVGGQENIISLTHCMTRLRIKLRDNTLVNKEKLCQNDNIISTQEAEGKLQIIIGTHVGDVYEETIRQTGRSNERDSIDTHDRGSLINNFAAIITKIVVPSLGVLMACGIIAGLNSVLSATGVITTDSGVYILLNAMGNACLTFFPVVLGYTSAVAFGLDPFIGMILGAILIFPNLSQMMNDGDILFKVLANTPFEMVVYKTFLGLPIIFPSMGYTSTLIPIMLINLAASYLEKFLKKKLPPVTQQFFIPFITIFVAGVLGVLIIGPISMILQNGLQALLSWLINISQILAFTVITLIYQPLVIFGLHWPLITLGLMEYAAVGNSLIIAAIFPASFTHMAACLAIFLKTKNSKTKNISFAAFLSACFCIIEPSIYGVTLPVKKRFVYCMIGGLVGGIILVLAQAPMYAVSMGVTGFMAFVAPGSGSFFGLIWCTIACLAAMITTFSLTWLSYSPEDDGQIGGNSIPKMPRLQKEILGSPMKGDLLPISKMEDVAFSEGGLGKGVCIIPSEGKIVSPCNGIIEALYPTGHAIGIRSDHGAEILIHFGINTYQLDQSLFHQHKMQGDRVKKGELLVTFDLDALLKQAINPQTAVVISNSSDYLDVLCLPKKSIMYQEELIATIVSETERDI